MPTGVLIGKPSPIGKPASEGRCKEGACTRARAYTLYSLCFLPSILHLLAYCVVIQWIAGEGKRAAAFTEEREACARTSSDLVLMMREISLG